MWVNLWLVKMVSKKGSEFSIRVGTNYDGVAIYITRYSSTTIFTSLFERRIEGSLRHQRSITPYRVLLHGLAGLPPS